MKVKTTVIFFLVLLTSCSSFFSNTNLVKDYVDEIDPSITLGQALDTYKYFTKTEWEEFTTDRGKEVVEFKGYYFENDIVVRIQFLINKDWAKDKNGNSFKFGFQGYKFKWEKDSDSKSFNSNDLLSNLLEEAFKEVFGEGAGSDNVITRIYKNKKLYFPNLQLKEKSSIKNKKHTPKNIEETTTKNDNVFDLPPNASQHILTDEDLNKLSKQELQIMRNEIFARHGYIFRKGGKMDTFFRKQEWYQPKYKNVNHLLSEIEKENIKNIRKFEKR